jgi:Pyridoxal-dependent decarboxylase, pyridoxal binding domain
MTAYVPALRFHVAADRDDRRLDEVVALRRCAQYRKAFRWAAVSYPADVARLDAAADFVRRYGSSVDVADTDELETALSAAIDPLRVILHPTDSSAGSIRDAMHAGVGRIVVNSTSQVDVLAATLHRRQRVLIEVTDRPVGRLAEDVVSGRSLDLIGLHRRLTPGENGTATVTAMIAAMRRIAQRHAVIPARLSLADVDVAEWGCEPADLRGLSTAIGDAVETGCIAGRFARPAVNVSPSPAALLPGAQRDM